MLETKYPLFLVFVTLLRVSSGGSGHGAEEGKESIIGLWCWVRRRVILRCLFRTEILSGEEDAATGELEAVHSTVNSTNVTDLAYGIAGNVAAVLLYGSIFVPVKKIEVGDGKHMEVALVHI